MKILAKYLNRADRPFIEEMYNLAKTHIDGVSRVDPVGISTALEFSDIRRSEPRGSLHSTYRQQFVDKLGKEKFIESSLVTK